MQKCVPVRSLLDVRISFCPLIREFLASDNGLAGMFSAADEERQRQRAEAKRQKEAKKRKKEAEKKKKAEQNDLISNILTSMPQHPGGKWRFLCNPIRSK